ncbi:nitroreductase [Colletotrichum truncatum]|uniref:Nitroreductase n=1 Tax=Colletotrichum truncatum TaxID=5467 RepID=A0ACC3ZDV1_COLTU|nr:nitroreductase [Colletotrichum truncatum]XP_036585090.1 nitroreductase [Colletotrichum truncatum]KAF6780568.1 nitroreductase [Colletotrichum truncatum]KAF6794858.1 nitroreductase [Colletotrichum truncatum]
MSEERDLLLQQKYGHSPKEGSSDLPWSPTLSLLLRHTSVRSFLPDALPAGTLEILIAAGQSASTSSMLQSWSAVAITDPARKDAVATLAGDQDFIRQAPLFILFCADLSRLDKISKRLQKPGLALQKMDSFLMATIDATLAAQNMAIAAESLGLGMCYVGAARNNAAQLTELLNLPPRAVAIFGMSVGKSDPESLNTVKPRLPIDEVLHREVWNDEGQEERVSSYDKALNSFYESQNKLNREPWSSFAASAMASENLDGRERLRGVLDAQGFGFS